MRGLAYFLVRKGRPPTLADANVSALLFYESLARFRHSLRYFLSLQELVPSPGFVVFVFTLKEFPSLLVFLGLLKVLFYYVPLHRQYKGSSTQKLHFHETISHKLQDFQHCSIPQRHRQGVQLHSGSKLTVATS